MSCICALYIKSTAINQVTCYALLIIKVCFLDTGDVFEFDSHSVSDNYSPSLLSTANSSNSSSTTSLAHKHQHQNSNPTKLTANRRDRKNESNAAEAKELIDRSEKEQVSIVYNRIWGLGLKFFEFFLTVFEFYTHFISFCTIRGLNSPVKNLNGYRPQN